MLWDNPPPFTLEDVLGPSNPLVVPGLQAWRMGRVYESCDDVLCILLVLVGYYLWTGPQK